MIANITQNYLGQKEKKDETMEQGSEISRIRFRSGMVDKLSEINKCPEITFTAPAIPVDILTRLNQDSFSALKNSYGNPAWGEPIQYDYLEVASSSGVKTVEVYNRAVLLLSYNTEETRRVHRIMYAFENILRADS